VGGELGRRAERSDRLLHELKPIDRVQRDDSVPSPLDRDRPVRPGEHEPDPPRSPGKTGSAPLDPLRRPTDPRELPAQHQPDPIDYI
jgi:hypothetical protein